MERGDLQGAHELLRKHAGSVAGDADYYAFDAAVPQRLGRHKEAVAGYREALDAYRRAKFAGGLSPPLLAFVDQRMKQLQ
ncbi:MAG: hypothetical protein JJE42_00370 [Burkholderiales bacterium]|nr:hypothetical protein [Burkholderiales bacterium]